MIIVMRRMAGEQVFQLLQPDDRSGCRHIMPAGRCHGATNHLGPHFFRTFKPRPDTELNRWVRLWPG